ncbi:MAG: CMP-N,N-diacetyllegionaminic acid synthase [Solirubrobacteraceae bacterium]|nr:CMP-N,N-diacetyllegionaminic acid synthase [Solirubrobacteraceae bacterium]
MTTTAVALIPARAGSVRVPHKNIRPLAGHPLIAYTIAAAIESGVFADVVVSTDSEEIAAIARHYGAEVPELRPPELATSTSPDVEWVVRALDVLQRSGRTYELFSILRPTSPFRSAATIRGALDKLEAAGAGVDSIRAVRRCREHPGKMWTIEGDMMRPLLAQPDDGVPLHSRQFQALPEVWVQDSSLEIARTRVLADRRDIAGTHVAAFVSERLGGFSIDYPEEFELAERMIELGEALLPAVAQAPYRLEQPVP